MKRTTTLMAVLLTTLLAASSVQAGPFMFFDQLFGALVTESGDQDQREIKGQRYDWLGRLQREVQPQDGTGLGDNSGIGGPHNDSDR